MYEIQKRYAGCNGAYNLLNFYFCFVLLYLKCRSRKCNMSWIPSIAMLLYILCTGIMCTHIFIFMRWERKKEPFLIVEIMITNDFDRIVQSIISLDIITHKANRKCKQTVVCSFVFIMWLKPISMIYPNTAYIERKWSENFKNEII